MQVGHFTLDNASNNETWMKELETILLAHDIPLTGRTITLCIYSCAFYTVLNLHLPCSGAFHTSYKYAVTT
jgi:hypothetical protein